MQTLLAQESTAALPQEPKFPAFDPPADKAVALNFGVIEPAFLTALDVDGRGPATAKDLLPPDSFWQRSADQKQPPPVPLPLCEFLAYRAALAYEDEATVRANVGGFDSFAFFDSKGRVADTQGFGFTRDGVAFLIMRGTESRSDWAVNTDDALTDSLAVAPSRALRWRLSRRYGSGVSELLERIRTENVRGRHRGFAIAWAAVEDDVLQKFVATLPRGTPIVVSGHSLGGALAQIGGYALANRGYPVAAVVTFGAPMVGNKDFVAAYNAKLGPRTVLIESTGDFVPRVMRSGFYWLNRELQQFVLNLIKPPVARASSEGFDRVGASWAFEKEPLLGDNEVERVIQSIIKAREQKESEAKERAEKQEKERREAEARKSDGRLETKSAQPSGQEAGGKAAAEAGPGTTAGGTAPSGGAGRAQPGSGTAPSTSPGGAQSSASGDGGQFVLMVIAGIVIVVILLLIWVFVRRKLSAHAIMERYALFLSTLSYQRIRSLHAGGVENFEAALGQANEQLGRYMRFIRGVSGDYASSYYKSVADLPVRLKPGIDLATFSSVETNII